MTATDTALATTTITTRSGFEALRDDWEELLDRLGNVVPFYLHEWLISWWDHLRQDQRTVRDLLRVTTVRSTQGRLVAAAPFMLTERPAFGPFRARVLQGLGADPNLTELRGIIVDPAYESAAARAFLAHWQADPGWDWIHLCGLVRGSAFTTELESSLPLEWGVSCPHYSLELPATWESFKKSLRRNIRESLRHCYNSLKRDGLEFTFDVAEDPTSTARALPEFLRLHTLRSGSKSTVAHPDRFGMRITRAFLESVMDRLSAKGSAKLFSLTVDGKVVAARIGFVVGGSLYFYYSGYEPAFAKYSVMTTTVAEMIRWAIARGLTSVDLSVGTDVSKTRWGPREIVVEDATSTRPTIRARTAYAGYRFASDARSNPSVGRITALLGRRRWE